MKLVLGDYKKTATWWGGNDTFNRGRCRFGVGDFSGGFWLMGGIPSPTPEHCISLPTDSP